MNDTDKPETLDTVGRAHATPDEWQPYAELGLKDDEYERIRQIIGRRPTRSELAMYSIMWSEHCSYKSSRVHFREFAEKSPKTDRLLAGIGENAGVIALNDDVAVSFKIESHNHPSYIEPHQGAATGVGGIVRDILAMGARPVAVMDALRFGAADHDDTARVLPGVVEGISNYGNSLGLPNIGGETVFDPCYQNNPLVNALCLGVMPTTRLQSMAASGVGNIVVLLGAKTGRDGIGGVSVLASASFNTNEEAARPSVQVGDPFTEKLLIESSLEMFDAGLVAGIQDLGGAGLTCALSETAAAAKLGMYVELDRVPLRDSSMTPHEVLASESQERMLLIVEPSKLDDVLEIASRWGVLATPIGEVTDSPHLIINWHDATVVDCPPASLADEGPVYNRPIREPADTALIAVDRAETLPRPKTGADIRETALELLGSPNLCDKSWITNQYDHYVRGNTVHAQPQDNGIVRIDEETGLGVVLAVDGNSRYCGLDPYAGTQLAVAEAYRNVAMSGAKPVAITNCLNFGSPEDPGVMWQFSKAVEGLADASAHVGLPITGGNVSFYNQTNMEPIHPTPVVGVLGVIDNVADAIPSGFSEHGNLIMLLGETDTELSGSEWAWLKHGHLGGTPPKVDLDAEMALGAVIHAASREGHIAATHDLSQGGLWQALAESVLLGESGAHITLPNDADPFAMLFSETSARAVISVPRGREAAVKALCNEFDVPWTPLGAVDSSINGIEIDGLFAIDRQQLDQTWRRTLPDLFGH
ncbi:MAG TPA: phosphoribosylformylglycinamidine synthase subunit PurL [Candidatus Stackebrandtia faecavium]|nr:phosphoribosylformylglycinamidine synthase subunit PurL [Candidatus Stackebrandtia faecavium]